MYIWVNNFKYIYFGGCLIRQYQILAKCATFFGQKHCFGKKRTWRVVQMHEALIFKGRNFVDLFFGYDFGRYLFFGCD